MTADTQLAFPVDATPADPHADARRHVVEAIALDAELHGGIVSPNRVRALLTNDAGGLTVNPRRLAAAYASPLLVRVGETRSDDRKGRNVGAVLNLYSFRGGA